MAKLLILAALLTSSVALAQFAPGPFGPDMNYLNQAYLPMQYPQFPQMPPQIPMVSPFIGTPYFESAYYSAIMEQRLTGQGHFPLMPLHEAYPVLVANRLNWNGASAFGLAGSYMPPIGLNAVSNSLTYSAIAR